MSCIHFQIRKKFNPVCFTDKKTQNKTGMTYHFPYMKTNIQSKVNKGYSYSDLEFFDEDIDEAGLEDVGVEEEQEHHDNRKQDTYILNTEKQAEQKSAL